MGNGILCHEESHILLVECFQTFLWCIKMIGGDSDSISETIWLIPCHVYRNNYQLSSKKINSEQPFTTWKGILCHKERHTLLLSRFITFLWCIKMIQGASGSISKLLMAKHNVISAKNLSNFKQNHIKFSNFPRQISTGIGGWVMTKDIHCCLSVSQTSSDV